MKPNLMMSMIPAGMLAGIFLFSSCNSGYSVASVTGSRIVVTDSLDANPDSAAMAVLAPYQRTVDSIMSPVIGNSARFMDRYRPESELSNLVADILRTSATNYIGRAADVAVTNMGGLRTSLPEGNITYGNIYEITPFENTLCIVTMNGALLKQLFENIAKVHGEGLSGARLEISKDGKLLSATVGGKELDENKEYKVATLDYLAEGNDHMDAFAKVPDADKMQPENATIRQLFLNYVNEQSRAGKKVDSKIEGRITVKE
ncbi:5'-nucleotidase C-terminal domain-containing protein [Bacteroidaceae bacterium]|jgi:2',3'-cyclic-nucleotide 2'-phosphodiesterase (5'-nucleotidase family)